MGFSFSIHIFLPIVLKTFPPKKIDAPPQRGLENQLRRK
jgi:hypothetical protein